MRKRRNLQLDLTLYIFEGKNVKFSNIGQNKFSKTKNIFFDNSTKSFGNLLNKKINNKNNLLKKHAFLSI